MKKIIGVISITNCISLNIYNLNDDYIVAGYNQEIPRKYKIYSNTKGFYFNKGKTRYYLDEILRIN